MDILSHTAGGDNDPVVNDKIIHKSTDMTLIINMFIEMLWLMTGSYEDVYVFGSVARMIATNAPVYENCDLDIHVDHNIDSFVIEIKKLIKIMNLNQKSTLTIKNFIKSDFKNTIYPNSIHYVFKLNYVNSIGKEKSFPVDIVSGIFLPPLNSWEIFQVRENGCTIRTDFPSSLNFMGAVKMVREKEILVFRGTESNFVNSVLRHISLIKKNPDAKFVPSWTINQDKAYKSVIPVYIKKLSNDAMCCICQLNCQETNSHNKYVFQSHCGHIICCECIINLIKHTNGLRVPCPMCRSIMQ